jgi:hypothetical protein
MADCLSLNSTGTPKKHCDCEMEIMEHVFPNGWFTEHAVQSFGVVRYEWSESRRSYRS